MPVEAGSAYTRQLTTVLSADAVGYSRAMGVAEELTLDRLVERRAIIEAACAEHGGRLFGVAGDSLMAEFGSPVDAIRAALAFQERIAAIEASLDPGQRLSFRAGINTGEMILRDGALFGDEVNIAARLQEIAAPGGLIVSATAFHNAVGRVAVDFADLGDRALKNIGVRVRAYAVSRSGTGLALAPAGPTPATAPSAVAVLPFAFTGPADDLAYLGDGLAEDIIIGLSNTRWLPVIAKSSTFQFRDAAFGSIAAAQVLGARYVVSGSVQAAGDRVQVKATLEDSATALILWSQRFDLPATDAHRFNALLGAEIVAALEKQVGQAEMTRAFRTPWEQPKTWQLVQQGRWHMHRRTRADTDAAFALFHQALATEPNSSMALNELAWWHIWRGWLKIGDRSELDLVSGYAGRALFMDSQDPRPHAWLGVVEILRGNPRAAFDPLAEAVRLNPSFAYAHAAVGTARILAGAPADAIASQMEAWRLSPFDLYAFHNFGELAAARLLTGDAAGALEAAERSLRLSPRYLYAAVIKLSALWRLGRREDARAARAEFEARRPDFDVERVKRIPFVDRTFVDRLLEGFRATAG